MKHKKRNRGSRGKNKSQKRPGLGYGGLNFVHNPINMGVRRHRRQKQPKRRTPSPPGDARRYQEIILQHDAQAQLPTIPPPQRHHLPAPAPPPQPQQSPPNTRSKRIYKGPVEQLPRHGEAISYGMEGYYPSTLRSSASTSYGGEPSSSNNPPRDDPTRVRRNFFDSL